MIGELLRSLQSQVVSPQTLEAFDSHFASCQAVFPPHCQIYHPQPLEPRHLSPICQLQNCRIVLHRHNLTTSCALEIRRSAIVSCVQAAKETVHLLQRVRQYQPPAPLTWEDCVAAASSTMVCTHIWRCILFLCFSALYDEALVCVDICSAIGELRLANIACGRNIYGFLRLLALRVAQNADLMHDEMMVALVSGDLQGSTESSWVWNGSQTGSALANQSSTGGAGQTKKDSGLRQESNSNSLSLEERKEWGGWAHVADVIKQLKREKEQRRTPPAPSLHPPHKYDSTTVNVVAAAATSSSRISIANII